MKETSKSFQTLFLLKRKRLERLLIDHLLISKTLHSPGTMVCKEKAQHSKQLRPHLLPAAAPIIQNQPTPIPSLKPIESSKSEPFNFLAELEKIKEKEKEITSKMGSMSTEEITKEMINIHELRKQLIDKNKEEQQRERLNQSQKNRTQTKTRILNYNLWRTTTHQQNS